MRQPQVVVSFVITAGCVFYNNNIMWVILSCRILNSLLRIMYHTMTWWLFCVTAFIHWSRCGQRAWSLDLVVCLLVVFVDCVYHVETLLGHISIMNIDVEVVGIGLFLQLFGTSLGVLSFNNLLGDLVLPGFSYGWPPWTWKCFCGLISCDFGAW